MPVDLAGTTAVGVDRTANGVDHVAAVGGKHRQPATSLGKLRKDCGPVGSSHREDDVCLGHERLRERLALVAAKVAPHFSHRLDRSHARGPSPPSGESGTGDHHPVPLDLVWFAAQTFCGHDAEERLGHRAAAGVARADKEHHEAGEAAERLLADDAGPHHAEATVAEFDRRWRLGVLRAAVIDDEGDHATGRGHDVSGGDSEAAARLGLREHHWAWQHPHAVRQQLVAWNPEP